MTQSSEKKPQVLNVLLVEDNPSHAHIVQRGFEEFPWPTTLEHMADGQDALDWLAQTPPGTRLPDLILLDLRLPRIDP